MALQPYSVIGFYPDNRQICCLHVQAENAMHAFAVAAQERRDDPEFELVSAHLGHLQEDREVFFPGEGLVDAETVLEDPEVFS